MTEVFSNFAISTLSHSIGGADTTISVAEPGNFPASGTFHIVAQQFDASGQKYKFGSQIFYVGGIPISSIEIMKVTSVGGGAFTVQRAQEGTTAYLWPSGTRIAHVVTAAVMTALEAGGGGGGGFTNTAVSNGSPYTAGTGQNIYTIYNTSGASYTFNLDATPATNDVCVIIDAGLTAAANPITIQGNGNNVIAGGASGTSYEIGSNGGAISLAWDGTQWTQYA